MMRSNSTAKHAQLLTPYQKRKFQPLWTLFPRMAEVLPESKSGTVEIKHNVINAQQAYELSHSLNELWTPGCFCQLIIDGHVWMHDILDERIKNERIVRETHGDVLITGLGLGMILHPILQKPEVRSVHVLENNPDVVSLVLPSLNIVPGREKLTLEIADAESWALEHETSFDAIWLDHLPGYAAEPAFIAIAEEKIARFRSFLREKNSYIGHWALEEARRAVRDSHSPPKRLRAEIPRHRAKNTLL